MDVQHIYTLSKYLDQLPIVNGQLIVLTDKHRMYYDIDDARHPVDSETVDNIVTLNTEQSVTGRKSFMIAHVDQLTQGTGCKASSGSHSEGQNSEANVLDTYAHAEGGGTKAMGKFSHSQGESSVAEGVGSFASGKETYALGDYSSANGVSSISSGKGSFSSGAATNALGDYSAALGVGNNPQADDLLEVGNGTVLGADGELLPEDSQVRSNAFRVTKDGRAIAALDVELESGIKLSDTECISNKVTSITSNATDKQYPTALAVKKYIDELPEPSNRKYCIVGSNTANTSGWYKVASQTMSGYDDTNVTFMITSTYKDYFSGILQLQMRSDNTFISCKALKWHSRIGFDVGDVICVIEDMAFTLYVHRSVSQYGRILFEVISESNITSASTNITLHNSTAPEITEPVATVIATDGAIVYSANQVNQIYLSTEDVDDIKPDNLTWYYTGGSTAVVNNPFGDGKAFAMCAYRAATGYRVQEAISYSGIKKVRYYNGTDWSDWRTLAYGDEYLPLGGGTLSSNNLGVLNIKRTTESNAGIGFENILGPLGYIAMQAIDGDIKHITADASKSYKILDENNYKNIVTPSSIGAAETSHQHADYVPLSGGTMTGVLNVTRINPVSALTNNLGTSANPFLSLFTDTVALRGDTSGASYGALNVSTPGTAETTGVSKLVLGNNTASGTESNAKGEITIYGTNTGSTVITAGNNSTSTVALKLPAESGTLALKSQITTLSSVYNVLKQINIKSSGSYNNKVCFVSKNPFSETFNGVTYTGYSTINEAITSEYNSSYTLNIIVLPGTYKEAVNIVNKKINVFGVDKHTCIVTNDEDYNNPPFAICSGNTIANLTIICNDDGSTSYSNLAYCVHMDYDYSGSPITIDNCIMHSYQSACIGFGTRGGSPFYVTNCEMYKHANSRLNSHNSFNNGVVYGHNAFVDQTVAEEIYFINNYMEAETGYSIYIFNANKYYPGGNGGSPDTKLTFVNNTVWSRDETQGIPHKLAPKYLTEVIPSYAYFGGGFIRTFGCAGNNAQFLNYKNSGEPLEIIGWSTAKNGTLTLSDYIGKYNYLFIETLLNSNGSRQNYESKMVAVNNLLNYNPKVQLYSITPSYATTAYYLLNFTFTENQMTISDFEIGSAWKGTSVSYKVSGVY